MPVPLLSRFLDKQSHVETWRLAWPMILAGITTPLLGLVDTAVVGHLDSPVYLGAVAIGGLIFSFVFWGFGFLRMGVSGMTAQALGAGDGVEVRALLGRGLLLALLLGLTLLFLQSLVGTIAFRLISAPAQVLDQARIYFDIRIWSAPATLAGYVLLGWFLGIQQARSALYLMLCINLLNIALDFLFVWGFGWGVAGVAGASVCAEYLGLLLGLWLVRIRLCRLAGHWHWQRLIDRQKIRRLLAVNRDIFIRTLCLIFSFAFFTQQSARQGELILAVNTVLLNFQTLMAYALDGFAHAAEALVGRHLGAGDRRALSRAVYSSGLLSLLVALLFAMAYLLWGDGLISLLTDIEPVRQQAVAYLPWLVLMPLVAVWAYWLDGIFIGATLTQAMRNTMLLSLLVYLLAWFVLTPLANHGLWLALMLFMAARGLSMAWLWRAKLGLHLGEPGGSR